MGRALMGCFVAMTMALTSGCGDARPQTTSADAGEPVPPPQVPDAGSPDGDAGVTIPLESAHAGGSPEAIAVRNGRAYIAVGSHVETWSLADPQNPVLLGKTPSLEGLVSSLTVAGDRAYVSTTTSLDSVIHILDVSNDAAPSRVGSFRAVEVGTASVILSVAAADGKLYAADLEQGIHVFDLAKPDAPTPVKLVPMGGVTRVMPAGTRLYYEMRGFAGNWFGIIDLTKDYEEVGGTSLADVKATALVNDLLVTVGIEGIVVFQFDAADPWTANEVFRVDSVMARAVAGSGTTAWIPAVDGLRIVDLSDPAAIKHTGPLDLPVAEGDAVAVSGELLTVATKRGVLVTIDVANPTAPAGKAVRHLSVCTNCTSLAFAEDGTLLVADVASGLKTAGLGDFATLGRGTVTDRVAMEDVTTANGVAYLSDWFHGLRIFDISTPAEPKLLSSLKIDGFASSVAIEGDRLILGESTDGGEINVIDVSDPSAPVILGSHATSKVRDLELRGDLVFVADEEVLEAGGLRIFDISNPQAIELVHHYAACRHVIDVEVAGNLAILACDADDFHLLDVANPAAPKLLSKWSAGGDRAEAVTVDGTRAYLGQTSDVVVIDISNPAAPTKLQRWPVAFPVRAVASPFPGRIVAACSLGGLYQWELE